MRTPRWRRVAGFVLLGMVVGALLFPAVALASVGGPYSESISNTEDNGICDPSGGGGLDLGDDGDGLLTWEADSVLAPQAITATVWNVRGGPATPDGAFMRTLVEFGPDGFVFEKNLTLSLDIPADIVPATASIYAWDPGLGNFTKMATSRSGDKVTTEIMHFSWYGVGGTPLATTSVPASSPWSVSLTALAAMAVMAVMLRKRLVA